jgi:hypothetical protein
VLFPPVPTHGLRIDARVAQAQENPPERGFLERAREDSNL